MHFRKLVIGSSTAAGLALSLAAGAMTCDMTNPGDTLVIQGAPDSIHFHPSPEHTKYSWAIGVEWQCASRWLAGFSYFNNSFGQKSQYIYGGKWWTIWDEHPSWYFKLSGGVILGYKEPYEDKIPFNHNGVAPGIIPGVGYKFNRANIQVNLLGLNGVMITFGYDLIR